MNYGRSDEHRGYAVIRDAPQDRHWLGMERRRPIFLTRRLRIAPRKSKPRYPAIDDQFRGSHEGGTVSREEQGCLSDFPSLAETMKRDLIPDCRGRFVELLLGKSELAVKRRADRAGLTAFTRMPRDANSARNDRPSQRTAASWPREKKGQACSLRLGTKLSQRCRRLWPTTEQPYEWRRRHP